MGVEIVPPASGLPRAVVADDHPTVLIALGRMLEPFCQVLALVSTGVDAVEAVIRLKPDVLVTDLRMPDIDGLEVCRRVKDAVPDTAVVIVTAFADTQFQTAALRAGAAAFVPKHQAVERLVTTIQQIIANKATDSVRSE